MKVHALIDGDWIIYAAGFAGQKQALVCPTVFGAQEFKNITEFREAYAQEEDGDWNAEQDPVYKRDILDPESHVYHSAKLMIEKQLQRITEKFGVDEIAVTVLVDGDGNFRSRLATMRPYKGNRHPLSKPIMFNDVRGYLLNVWDAEVVYDQETDDEMTIRATQLQKEGVTSVIVGVDKDYMQCPGWILNPSKGFKKIKPQEGLWRLYVQALEGDTADNIPGAYKIGAKFARRQVPKGGTEQEMWDAVVSGFEGSMEKYPSNYPEGMTPYDAALENMRLVYLRREYDEMWVPPNERA